MKIPTRKPTLSSGKPGGRFSWRSKRSRILLSVTAAVLAVTIAAVSIITPTLAAPTATDAVNWAYAQTQISTPYQCLTFVQKYTRDFWSWSAYCPTRQGPYDIISGDCPIPSGWQKIAGATPKAGDIVLFIGGGYDSYYGHIGIAVSATSMIDANGGADWNYYQGTKPDVHTIKSNGYWGVVRPPYAGIEPPSTPASASFTPANVGIGATVSASWASSANATKYVVSLVCTTNSAYNQAAREVTGTSASFTLSNAGTYKVSVRARNSAGDSGTRDSGTVVVHPNITVTFKDWDATTLKQQSVIYGGSAAAPSAPSREGYTFQGWDKGFSSVIVDTVVTATYKINTYNVRFVDDDGNLLKTQTVNHGAAATPPSVTPPAGYKFVDWDSHDYELVKKDMTIAAVFAWENPDLPNITQIISAVRNTEASGYNVTVKLQNAPLDMVRGRVIVALKTAAGKMVASATETYYLTDLASAARTVYVPYSGVATKVEVSVVGLLDDENTGVPLAQLASASIDLGLTWSDWSTELPPDGGYITESRTEFRYRDKQTTTSNSPTLNGWALYDTTWVWGPWNNVWLDSNPNPSNSPDRETKTQQIPAQYKTQYAYERWKYWNASIGAWLFKGNGSMGGTYAWYGWFDSPLSYDGNTSDGPSYRYYYNGVNYEVVFNQATQQVQTVAAKTQWQYRDKVYTYHFERWLDWSDWEAGTAPAASTSKEVETRTVYRYKSDGSDLLEDNNGTVRSVSGNINAPGKLLTLLVFRQTNADPTASQLQYVAQTTIDANGDYSFDYITKNEPTPQTGDFIVMVAVEGGTAPVYVETIKAPPRSYTVVFTDDEGNELSRQVVEEGESAAQPAAPEKEGYDFIGWNESTANIRKDLTIAAVFAKKTYDVVFNDWDGSEISIEVFEHGDALSMETVPEKEGGTFVGWHDLDGNEVTTVTSNGVVVAQYTVNTYTVEFLDWDGSVLSEQQIEYGEAAELPSIGAPPQAGQVFSAWSDEFAAFCVKEDLVLVPQSMFAETVAEPVLSVSPGSYSDTQTVSITCATPDAKIFFTTDGTLPQYEQTEVGTIVNGIQYYSPIMVSEDTVLAVMAFADGKNNSPLSYGMYEITDAPIVDGDYGDVNGDGLVDLLDLQRLTQHLSGWDVEISPGADVNGDGEVGILDLQRLTQYLSGWDVTLGPS